MKKFYIFEKDWIDPNDCHFSIEAKNEEEALQVYFKAQNIPEDEQWRYFVSDDDNFLKNYFYEKRLDEEYEIVGRRPIEL